MKITLSRCNYQNTDFQSLVNLLDHELAIIDGEEHTFYHQYNSISDINHAVVAYYNDIPIGCGSIKPFENLTGEIKRMYVKTAFRNKGVAGKILQDLETWAVDIGFTKLILETGKNQKDAIALYNKHQYIIMDNYGPYKGAINSFCFQKNL